MSVCFMRRFEVVSKLDQFQGTEILRIWRTPHTLSRSFQEGEIGWRRRRGEDNDDDKRFRQQDNDPTHMCLATSAMDNGHFSFFSSQIQLQIQIQKSTSANTKHCTRPPGMYLQPPTSKSKLMDSPRFMSCHLILLADSDSKFTGLTDRTSFTCVAVGQMQKRFQ